MVLNMCWVSYKWGFWIFQDSQYARVMNFPGYTGFTHFHKYDRVLNMCWDANMEGFWIFHNSKYARFICMQALHHILNMPEWCLNKLFWLWQGSEYVWPKVHRVLNMPPVLNMARFWICRSYTWCWICLNEP